MTEFYFWLSLDKSAKTMVYGAPQQPSKSRVKGRREEKAAAVAGDASVVIQKPPKMPTQVVEEIRPTTSYIVESSCDLDADIIQHEESPARQIDHEYTTAEGPNDERPVCIVYYFTFVLKALI